ncbi:hypothetical protein SAMN04488112_11265 [Melghirimyces thermohalophilus]|uniref:Uncharacterized protein n=1 Tax=Melghirimyces thermohalophilus TaxID=1236220 RepID=A0A1G6NBH5_9BACL|nr:hypothetical protein SAMN04488112_11265 [Melghirimyces thermohalophilus]
MLLFSLGFHCNVHSPVKINEIVIIGIYIRLIRLVQEGLQALQEGQYHDEALKKKLESLVESLDNKQFEPQDLEEVGSASEEDVDRAFNQARSDAKFAAENGLYEVSSIFDDVEAFIKLVDLQEKPGGMFLRSIFASIHPIVRRYFPIAYCPRFLAFCDFKESSHPLLLFLFYVFSL